MCLINKSLKRLVLRVLTFTLFAFALAACGGSSGTTSAPPAPVPTNVGGIWEGTSNTSGLILDFVGVFTEGGEGRFFDENGTQYIVSNVSGNDGSVTMNFTAVAQFGFVFLDGSTVTNGTVSGTIVERTSFNGDSATVQKDCSICKTTDD